jgi:hypothetical protein
MGLGLVREMRSRRYYERQKSKNVYHTRAMVKGARRADFNEKVKLGKIDLAALAAARRKH